ncbi:flagellar hook-associated protein 3 FlgL [Microterricola gilva]|uniref:Flagellar hook-associated protein 3 FlgL n=1 Tax=Microterricola gilva TaxID=393267 RepID=A0A4Q8ALU3_9MICO|nr:flagellar hook-associated protein FlgL [Microterricola gilva]RZU65552.1 flagellar hook-associated protein 3 FlgL [Microterricola gilva]
MISRVTQQTSMLAAQRNLQSSAGQLAKLQDQAMTRKAFSRASEDPSGAADAMRIRSQQRANDQYSRNIDNGLGWVTTIDSTLTESNDAMKRVRDLTVQGANDGALSPTAKEAIAVELDSLKEQLLGLANTQYLGRSVFAGNSSDGVAFNPDFSFTGAAGSTVERRIGADTTVRVDGDGAAAFGVGANSVFALIDTIATELRAGTNIGARLGDIDQRMNALRTEHSAVGSRHALIMRAEETVMDKTGSLEAQRAAVEDIELSRIILDLKAQEISYQAALGVTARVLQPTLMDFLR